MSFMLSIDLTGKNALVAGVADDRGFGFAISKALAEAGARVFVAVWPPAYGVLTKLLALGRLDESLRLTSGDKLEWAAVYPLDADYDSDAELPAELRASRRYRELGDVSIAGLARRLERDLGEERLDIVVHSIANGPEVDRPLLETSRAGYLAALSTSSYSFTSMVKQLAPIMNPGSAFLALTHIASSRIVPGYGGGMAAAKAALESDTRTLAYETGRRWGHRVNAISAGAFPSRAAQSIPGIATMIEESARVAPLPESITAAEVGAVAAFLSSPLASGVTATTVHVDKGVHALGPITRSD
jgi:enoyl-[acyl-carrier protein] reductase I